MVGNSINKLPKINLGGTLVVTDRIFIVVILIGASIFAAKPWNWMDTKFKVSLAFMLVVLAKAHRDGFGRICSIWHFFIRITPCFNFWFPLIQSWVWYCYMTASWRRYYSLSIDLFPCFSCCNGNYVFNTYL